jgi:hypothetical protein
MNSASVAMVRFATTIARDGSAGVENTLSIRKRRVEGSIHTQSVNVPPVSIAMRRGSERRAMVAEN